MKDGGYLTIEETAEKLGRPASWVKDRICEGRLGAKLAGRRWLVSPQDCDELLLGNPPPPETERVVHNFLADRATRKPRSTPKHQPAPRPTQKIKARQGAMGASPPAREGRPKRGKGKGPTLTQRIRELDREFDRLSARLRAAILEHRATIRPGKKAKGPKNLVREWKKAKAELLYLIAKADAKGLTLPKDLCIHRMLAQGAGSASKSVAGGRVIAAGSAAMAKGIEGYYAGPSKVEKRFWFNEED